MPKKRKTTRRKLQRVSVRAEMRSEPDWDRFAWALIQHTKITAARRDADNINNKKVTKL
jgi:hypothetical protein